MLTLIEAYEAKQFSIGLPDPIEAIKFPLSCFRLSIFKMTSVIM